MHKGVAMAVPRTLERRTKMHKDVERTLGLPRRDSSRRPWLRRRCAAGQPIMAAAAFQAALSFAQLPTYFVEAPPVRPGRFRCGRLVNFRILLTQFASTGYKQPARPFRSGGNSSRETAPSRSRLGK